MLISDQTIKRGVEAIATPLATVGSALKQGMTWIGSGLINGASITFKWASGQTRQENIVKYDQVLSEINDKYKSSVADSLKEAFKIQFAPGSNISQMDLNAFFKKQEVSPLEGGFEMNPDYLKKLKNPFQHASNTYRFVLGESSSSFEETWIKEVSKLKEDPNYELNADVKNVADALGIDLMNLTLGETLRKAKLGAQD